MRSYWLSLSVVLGLLFGYTALVLKTHAPSTIQPSPRASLDQESREPATAAQVVTTPESVN